MRLVLPIAALIVIVDQASKFLIISNFGLGEFVPVIPGWFDIRYIRNTGAAWGMFSGFNHGLVILSFAMIVLLIIFRKQFISETMVHKIAFGLMAGGIVGNLIDRIKWQYVVDFLDFYYKEHHFPAFNVADSAICTGVGLYILMQFLLSRKKEDGKKAGDKAVP